MVNIHESITGHTLTLTIQLDVEGRPSSTGKSMILASTEGNQSVPGFPSIKYGLNVYRK